MIVKLIQAALWVIVMGAVVGVTGYLILYKMNKVKRLHKEGWILTCKGRRPLYYYDIDSVNCQIFTSKKNGIDWHIHTLENGMMFYNGKSSNIDKI